MLWYYSNPNFYTRLFIGGMMTCFIFLNYLVLYLYLHTKKNPSIELSPYLWGRTKKNSRTIQVRNLVDWLFMICLQYSKIKNVLILTIWSTIKLKRNLKNRYTVCITLQKLRRFCLMKWSSEILSNLPYKYIWNISFTTAA